MARRREFTGIAKAMLGSFISRNNDVSGFWGVGRLCRHAQALGIATLGIDLLDASGERLGDDFDPMIAEFRRMLLQQCEAQSVPLAWLRSARIDIRFDPTQPNAAASETMPDTPFTCFVILEDDTGALRQASMSGRCWVTDPARECRRICDDWNRRAGSAVAAGGDLIG